jgi:AraC-like DNA-binding protein
MLLKEVTFSEAGHEVGFESLSHFNKAFKNLTAKILQQLKDLILDVFN